MGPLLRRSRIARAHRWLAIALAPVIALMLVSGIVLAARPWMESRRPRVQRAIDVERLIANVTRLDSAHVADLLFVLPQRTQFVLVSRAGGPRGPFDITTGAPVPEAPEPAPELFDRAGAVHDHLGTGQGWLGRSAAWRSC
jgi:sulfite reductase (NADPH) flavoprotein alpha-component